MMQAKGIFDEKGAFIHLRGGSLGCFRFHGFCRGESLRGLPEGHWAYDAVAQLAADGVIEGYGDGTYRGDPKITRFEMAKMIARAMANGGGDRATLGKLAGEVADELNNLGVRVANLEKKVDNMTWKGQLRYRYHNEWEIDEGVIFVELNFFF